MTDIINRAKAALEGTSEGPWSMPEPPYDSFPWLHVYCADGRGIMHEDRSDNEKIANAHLTAAAPDLIRDIIAEVERLRGVMNGIAMQPRLHEHEGEEGDFEYAYDMCVSIARAALNNNGEGE